MSVHQISIFLENRAGQLAEITRLLADNHINLRALNIAETKDYGVLRLIVDDVEKATAALLETGCILSKTPVMAVVVPDVAGGLAEVLDVLAEGNIDVEYMYSMFPAADGRACMIFRLKDEATFASLLMAHGLHVATKDELGLK
ncbi:MAG: ACT domain-containing protein [Aristaeellaceae bacterium]